MKKVFEIIRWVDATSNDDWKEKEEEVVDIVDSFTSGWVVHEDDDKVVIAQSITSDKGRGAEWAIPKISIKARFVIRLPKAVKF